MSALEPSPQKSTPALGEPYLILHKVRGEPAYDIANLLDMSSANSGEEWWIIPTSGHRAYPYKVWPLSDLEGDVGQGYFKGVTFEVPENLRDHYHITNEPRQEKKKLDLQLADLGL